MWWTKIHLRKSQAFIILYTILFFLGMLSINRLRFSISPKAYSDTINIKTQYFGMDCNYIEKNITIPIEEAVSMVKGIKNISSVSEEGESIVTLQIDTSRNLKNVNLEIKSIVDIVRQNFPQDVQEPVISYYDPNQTPVAVMSFYSTNKNKSLKEVRDFVAKELKPLIQKIDGVADCIVTGGKQSEIGVFADMNKLYALGLQLQDLNRSIQENNIEQFLGEFQGNEKNKSVFFYGSFQNIEDIGKVSIQTMQSNDIILTELNKIVSVQYFYKRIDSISRVNGIERVSLYIQNRSIANILSVCEGIKNVMKTVELGDIIFEYDFDKSQEISESLNNLILSIIISIAILFLCILFFLHDIKKCIISIVPIPISIAATFIFADIFQIELNSMILSGISLGIGLLVDNGLIILEFFHKPTRKSLNYHILSNLKKLIPPLVASLLTTICVFIPVLLSSIELRYFYFGFALMITFLLTISLLLAIGLIPILYNITFKNQKNTHKNKRYLIDRWMFYLRILFVNISKKFNRHRFALLSLLVFFLAFSMLALFLKGQEITASSSISEVYAYIEPATGTSIEATDELSKKVEKILMEQLEIEKVISKVEKSRSTLIIKFKKSTPPKETEQFINNYKKILSKINTFIYFTYGDATSNNKEISLLFFGENSDTLKTICKESARALYSTPYFSDVILRFKDDSPVYFIYPDHLKMQYSGLTLKSLIDECRVYLYGIISSKFNPYGKGMVDIKLSSKDSMSNNIKFDDFLNLMIENKTGEQIPLNQLITYEKGESSSKIYHYNKKRMLSITVRLKEEIDISQGIKFIETEMQKIKLPEGYFWSFDENLKHMQETAKQLIIAVILAVYFTLITLVVTFENVKKAFDSFFAIIFSLPGVAFTLYLFDFNLSLPIYMGVIILSGISVNNSVLLLSDIEPQDNFIKTIMKMRGKIDSIVLTTITTVLGLIPLIFTGGSGQSLWKPFSLTIIFGLISSSVLCCLMLPVLLNRKVIIK